MSIEIKEKSASTIELTNPVAGIQPADVGVLGGVKLAPIEWNLRPNANTPCRLDKDGNICSPIYGAIACSTGVSPPGTVKPSGQNFTVDNEGIMLLRRATTSSLGGVMVDGKTITIDNSGKISAVQQSSGGGSDITTIVLKGDYGYFHEYYEEAKTWIYDYIKNPSKYQLLTSNGIPIFYVYSVVSNIYFCYMDSSTSFTYIRAEFTDNTYKELAPKSEQPNYQGVLTTYLTDSNWQNYIQLSGGGDWQVTTSVYDSNLYNAKEAVIFWEKDSNKSQSYLNLSCDYSGNIGATWGTSNWLNTMIVLDWTSDYNHCSITYDGSSVNTSGCNVLAVAYKT